MWNHIKNSYKLLDFRVLWIGIIVEILFFTVWGFLSSPVINGIEKNVVYLGDEIITSGFNIHSLAFLKILYLIIVLLVVSYVIYCIFHGFLWKFSFNLKERKKDYSIYIKKFFLLNLFWLPFFVLYYIVNFFFSYMDNLAKRYNTGFAFMGDLSNILLLVIVYFAFVSYVLVNTHGVWASVKKSFKLGKNRFLQLAAMYLTLMIAFLFVNLGMYRLNQLWVVLIGILVIAPLMIFSRVFIKEVVVSL